MIYQTNATLDLAPCACAWICASHLLNVYEGRRHDGRK